VVHGDVTVGDGSTIEPYCVLGSDHGPLSIGYDATIRSHTVIYGDSVIGDGLTTGHHVVIRGRSVIGNWFRIGTFSIVEGHVRIGDCVRTQSGCQLSPGAVIGDFVWLFPNVQFTNDPMPPSGTVDGVRVDDLAVVCTNVLLHPGVRVGFAAFVAANSVVKEDVPPCVVAAGDPARVVCRADKMFKDGVPWTGWTEKYRQTYPEGLRGRFDELVLRRNQHLTNIAPGL